MLGLHVASRAHDRRRTTRSSCVPTQLAGCMGQVCGSHGPVTVCLRKFVCMPRSFWLDFAFGSSIVRLRGALKQATAHGIFHKSWSELYLFQGHSANMGPLGTRLDWQGMPPQQQVADTGPGPLGSTCTILIFEDSSSPFGRPSSIRHHIWHQTHKAGPTHSEHWPFVKAPSRRVEGLPVFKVASARWGPRRRPVACRSQRETLQEVERQRGRQSRLGASGSHGSWS